MTQLIVRRPLVSFVWFASIKTRLFSQYIYFCHIFCYSIPKIHLKRLRKHLNGKKSITSFAEDFNSKDKILDRQTLFASVGLAQAHPN